MGTGRCATAAFTPPSSHKARRTPNPPPASASTRLSVTSWRTRRPRPAPSARRTAISRRRAAARPIRTPAMLAQAIRRTTPAIAVIRTTKNSTGRTKLPMPRNASMPSTAKTSTSANVSAASGWSVRICRPAVFTAAAACAWVTPGRSRPKTSKRLARRSCSRALAAPSSTGSHRSVRKPAGAMPRKPAGMTPMTSSSLPFSGRSRPMIDGSAPKRARHV